MRLAVAAFALFLGAAAHAQTPVPAPQQVQLLAPQLLAFSGSSANFESLVSGLTAGTPVTLTTLGADGTLQVVTFLPGVTMSAGDAARTLEAARQALITRGIAAPNAQQLAVALMGGTLTSGVTSTALPGLLTGTTNASAIQVRNVQVAPAVDTATSVSAADLQALRASLPPASTASLSASDFNQSVQLALGLLAQQGIVNPTPEQLRVALLGGNLATPAGANVALQGVLQPRVRNTSESALLGTSTSPYFGTSNTPPAQNPIVTPNPAVAAPPSSGAALVRPSSPTLPLFRAR